jgi:hypothetical protein
VPQPAVSNFYPIDNSKAFGVTICRILSAYSRIDTILAACAQTLYAVHMLRSHGLPDNALHTVFQAVDVTKLGCAFPAKWGFITSADRACLEAFLDRAAKYGYVMLQPRFWQLSVTKWMINLFRNALSRFQHLLNSMLPT